MINVFCVVGRIFGGGLRNFVYFFKLERRKGGREGCFIFGMIWG